MTLPSSPPGEASVLVRRQGKPLLRAGYDPQSFGRLPRGAASSQLGKEKLIALEEEEEAEERSFPWRRGGHPRHIAHSLRVFQRAEARDADAWTAVASEGLTFLRPLRGITLREPKASRIPYTTLHPAAYSNIEELPSLDVLADILGAPTNWRVTVANATRHPDVVRDHARLVAVGDGPESLLDSRLTSLILCLADRLGMAIDMDYPTSIISGLLVRDHVAYRSRQDLAIKNAAGTYCLSTELKSWEAWPDTRPYHDDTKSPQGLAALYYTNSPMFLMTSSKFKLLVENGDRTRVFGYPWGDDTMGPYQRATATRSTTHPDFLVALALCLLAKRLPRDVKPVVVVPDPPALAPNEHGKAPARGRRALRGGHPYPQHLTRRTTRRLATRDPIQRTPRLLVDRGDGILEYRDLVLLPPELVREAEAHFARLDRVDAQAKRALERRALVAGSSSPTLEEVVVVGGEREGAVGAVGRAR